MSEYKELNLDREKLSEYIDQFMQSNGLELPDGIQDFGKRLRLEFGSAGREFAMVDIHLNANGTATVQWKLGRNQPLGERLAIVLKATIDPAEFEQVNLSLRGITADSFDPVLDCLIESGEFEISNLRDEAQCRQVGLKSLAYEDQLTLTHHRSTRVLQLQGRPLYCYRRTIFDLMDLLDLKGLDQVLCRREESSAEVVRSEMADAYLRRFFPKSYDFLPGSVKTLLISGACVKLASPNLPDYCLLLYPDLRGLEGVLKEVLCGYNMFVAEAPNGFGDFFDNNGGIFTLKPEYCAQVGHADMESALGQGYSFLSKHRNTLFHMEEMADASRMIDTLDKAIALSEQAYGAIEFLFAARM